MLIYRVGELLRKKPCNAISKCVNYSVQVWHSYKKKKHKSVVKIHQTDLPCSLSKSERFVSMSGLSALSTRCRHCDWRDERVTVKLTNVTREHMSGGNSTVGSLK